MFCLCIAGCCCYMRPFSRCVCMACVRFCLFVHVRLEKPQKLWQPLAMKYEMGSWLKHNVRASEKTDAVYHSNECDSYAKFAKRRHKYRPKRKCYFFLRKSILILASLKLFLLWIEQKELLERIRCWSNCKGQTRCVKSTPQNNRTELHLYVMK